MIALDGLKVASDAKLCEALLRDYCGEYRVEIAALTAAVRWGIPKSLGEAGLVPPATLRANLARRLQENHGLAQESAFWAVDAWASILGHPASGTAAAGETKGNSDADATAAWSALAGPVSPPAQQQSPVPPVPKPPAQPQWLPPPPPQSPALPKPPYQPRSPLLPPLPKPPSEPQAPPPPRPPYQPVSPILPPLPKQSEPQSPVLPPLPAHGNLQPPLPFQLQSPLPQAQPTALEFVPAARAFENREVTTQLRLVQTYLEMELKTRKAAALLEELRVAGVQPLTAKRLVAQALRGPAVRHIWIALAIFVACLLLMNAALSPSTRVDSETVAGSVAIFLAAGVYLVYRGVRLMGTF